ncbi:hypothetical protein HPT27_01150 [Permianibacter sp. IMCC34836]|uniref:serine aminopeptidase domain-containing protein n=1 Tax=Permianibacter fluminis TaxID=2738515 RepID=UPI001553846A|nr:alpha/beta hydrolase [Permianibacter fluminis]NQD35608.1 hypothetical protein [Permianibacter fluminis]
MSDVFFLPGTAGPLLAVHWPGRAQRQPVLLLPPLLEELNKSRRQLNQLARALHGAGHGVLLVDWFGTGDSAGDLANASWSQWQADVASARAFLQQQYAQRPALCAIRGGALLLPEHADCDWLLCAPILTGQQQLNQWLRLKLMAARMAGESLNNEQLLAQIAAGGVEIAGYLLTAALVEPLRTVSISAPAGSLEIFEIGAGEQPLPALQTLLNGQLQHWHPIAGDAFWQTTEISTCPALDQSVLQALAARADATVSEAIV